MLTRRGLFSLAAPLVMAPAIIRYSKIMPVRVWRASRWRYRTSDPIAVIAADGYFDRFRHLRVGDSIEVVRVLDRDGHPEVTIDDFEVVSGDGLT